MANSGDQARPVRVTWAVRALWASLLLAFLASSPGHLEPLPPEVPKWSLWILMALVFSFWAFLTLLIARRHNCARIVTLIFLGGLVLWIWDYRALAERAAYSLALDIVNTALTAIALYWLFTGAAASWFRRKDKHAL